LKLNKTLQSAIQSTLKFVLLGTTVAFSQAVFAHEPGAHVHGVATLEVALDAQTLTIDLSTPLDNLIGFEHLPQNDRQKMLVKAMSDRLHRGDRLFIPTAAASCTLQNTVLNSLVLDNPKNAKPQAAADGEEAGHADLDGEFVFTCTRPENLHDIEVRLFSPFPNLHILNVAVATAKGQTAAKLTADNRKVIW
jgi:hypothetical protein